MRRRLTIVLLAPVVALATMGQSSCETAWDDTDGPKKQGVAGATGRGGDCASGYDPCVPPYPPDVDCPDVGTSVSVRGADPHGLDADNDGVGCE